MIGDLASWRAKNNPLFLSAAEIARHVHHSM